MQQLSTAKPPIRLTSDRQIHLLRCQNLFQPLPCWEGFFSRRLNNQLTPAQIKGLAQQFLLGMVSRNGANGVGILQGSRRFGLEQCIVVWGVDCPVHPYCADLFSDARPAADPRFCDGLADQRQCLLSLERTSVDAKNKQRGSLTSTKQQKTC